MSEFKHLQEIGYTGKRRQGRERTNCLDAERVETCPVCQQPRRTTTYTVTRNGETYTERLRWYSRHHGYQRYVNRFVLCEPEKTREGDMGNKIYKPTATRSDIYILGDEPDMLGIKPSDLAGKPLNISGKLGPLMKAKRGNDSLRKIGETIGVSAATLSRIEAEQCQPDIESFRKICEWLNVNPSSLLGYQQPEQGELVETSDIDRLFKDMLHITNISEGSKQALITIKECSKIVYLATGNAELAKMCISTSAVAGIQEITREVGR